MGGGQYYTYDVGLIWNGDGIQPLAYRWGAYTVEPYAKSNGYSFRLPKECLNSLEMRDFIRNFSNHYKLGSARLESTRSSLRYYMQWEL